MALAFANVLRRSCTGVSALKPLRCQMPWTSQLLLKNITPAPYLLNSNIKQTFSTNRDKTLASEHKGGHNHTPIWTAERVLSGGLLALLPAAFYFPNGVLDYAAALVLVLHIHWGVEAIVIDYARPSVIGPTLANIAVALIYIFSAMTLGGLFYFNFSDVGLMQAVRMLWKL